MWDCLIVKQCIKGARSYYGACTMLVAIYEYV